MTLVKRSMHDVRRTLPYMNGHQGLWTSGRLIARTFGSVWSGKKMTEGTETTFKTQLSSVSGGKYYRFDDFVS